MKAAVVYAKSEIRIADVRVPAEIVLTGTFASSVEQFRRARCIVRKHAEEIEAAISTRCGLEDILTAVRRVQSGEGTKSVLLFPD